MKKYKVLLTAFEPFLDLGTNSSLEVLKKLNLSDLDYEIITSTLPVSYKNTKERLISLYNEIKPDFLIHLGQAGGESALRIEKVGLNYARSKAKCNDGILKVGEILDESLPNCYFSNVNIESIVDSNETQIPMYLSLSAGGFICNLTYFYSLHLSNCNSLFIHLPYFTNQLDYPKTMDLDKIVEGVTYIIKKTLNSVK